MTNVVTNPNFDILDPVGAPVDWSPDTWEPILCMGKDVSTAIASPGRGAYIAIGDAGRNELGLYPGYLYSGPGFDAGPGDTWQISFTHQWAAAIPFDFAIVNSAFNNCQVFFRYGATIWNEATQHWDAWYESLPLHPIIQPLTNLGGASPHDGPGPIPYVESFVVPAHFPTARYQFALCFLPNPHTQAQWDSPTFQRGYKMQVYFNEVVLEQSASGGSSGSGTPLTGGKIYWGGRWDGDFYQSCYGSPNDADVPFAGSADVGAALASVRAHVGKNPTLTQWGGLTSAWPPIAFNASAAALADANGMFSQYDWGTTTAGLNDILANNATAKAYIGALAQQIKNFGRPILFRPLWEMNGSWFAWGRSGLTSTQYGTIWRNVWQIFADVMGGFAPGSGLGTHTGNASFFWCPNIWSASGQPDPTPWYPAAADPKYVDWIGWDGYIGNRFGTTYKTPEELYGLTYATIAALDSTKPIAIGEWAVGHNLSGPGKDGFFTALLAPTTGWLATHPRIKCFSYFNDNSFESDPADKSLCFEQDALGCPGGVTAPQTAFAAAIADDYYVANIVTPSTFPSGFKVPLPPEGDLSGGGGGGAISAGYSPGDSFYSFWPTPRFAPGYPGPQPPFFLNEFDVGLEWDQFQLNPLYPLQAAVAVAGHVGLRPFVPGILGVFAMYQNSATLLLGATNWEEHLTKDLVAARPYPPEFYAGIASLIPLPPTATADFDLGLPGTTDPFTVWCGLNKTQVSAMRYMVVGYQGYAVRNIFGKTFYQVLEPAVMTFWHPEIRPNSGSFPGHFAQFDEVGTSQEFDYFLPCEVEVEAADVKVWARF